MTEQPTTTALTNEQLESIAIPPPAEWIADKGWTAPTAAAVAEIERLLADLQLSAINRVAHRYELIEGKIRAAIRQLALEAAEAIEWRKKYDQACETIDRYKEATEEMGGRLSQVESKLAQYEKPCEGLDDGNFELPEHLRADATKAQESL